MSVQFIGLPYVTAGYLIKYGYRVANDGTFVWEVHVLNRKTGKVEVFDGLGCNEAKHFAKQMKELLDD